MFRPVRARLCCLLPLVACAHGYDVPTRHMHTWSPPLPLAGPAPARLVVQFHAGVLIVEPGDRLTGSLQIDAVATESEALARLFVQVAPWVERSVDGAELALGVVLPAGTDPDDVETSYRLQVPAAVALQVQTRKGAVVARGYGGDLVVRGGSGTVEAKLDLGNADITTDTGSVQLRGRYVEAKVKTRRGRIDLQLPPVTNPEFSVDIDNETGDSYLEVHQRQRIDVNYRGDLAQVRSDARTRVDWRAARDLNRGGFVVGSFGDLQGHRFGELTLVSGGAVYVRLAPDGAGPGSGAASGN